MNQKTTMTLQFFAEQLGMDKASLAQAISRRLMFTVGKDSFTATERDWLHATIYAVRDRVIERWMETMRNYYRQDRKRVYYLSLEFLMGRALSNSLLSLGLTDVVGDALRELGMDLNALLDEENDAGLGNGGLGRLAACFLDSMATLQMAGFGYGIRYEYGIFRQSIENGKQVEHPDNWLRYGNPWEFSRPEVLFPVKFGGRVIEYSDNSGRMCHQWTETDDVMAMAFDTPIPGYGCDTVNNMRLWSARASRDFDLGYFNQGDYIQAVAEKNASENLAKVLYPADTTTAGKELRLKQQYFFVSASLQDIINRYLKHHDNFDRFADRVAIQLNDTHPAIAIPELMRILLDMHYLPWDKAWDTCTRTFAYTNHTLMPEALETWSVALMEKLLPRHMQIIFEINRRFLNEVHHQQPGNTSLMRDLSIIGEQGEKHVRMAHLAIIGSHRVNGVAQLHTELLKNNLFPSFNAYFPGKFINITNGITPRRWLNQANPQLSELISDSIDSDWLTNLSKLQQLTKYATDKPFAERYARVKHTNKQRLAMHIRRELGVVVDSTSLFDVQVKRIHEYKRQLLNLLHVVTRYLRIKEQPTAPIVPRTVIFAGKAAPSYVAAKQIIQLINDVADVINNDPYVGNKLKVVFLPNYSVSLAELIMPAADLSEQISTAGTEASGTGNMKLSLNGALTIGTLDGANIEIKQEVGDENIFIFGLTAEQVTQTRSNYQPRDYYHTDNRLRACLDMIASGFFNPNEPDRYRDLINNLLNHDQYMLLADYADYVRCQDDVDAAYLDQPKWIAKSILNVAQMGKFSSDRSIQDYADKIWHTPTKQCSN
ncbi:MAG: glycogen/starch/alpha-glucan phosphorylase [Gammaproteobacteria bacterium]|nr:glycogen/starch/alpha-glucan phosphorylase [Gammaproteobacteria bacterium]